MVKYVSLERTLEHSNIRKQKLLKNEFLFEAITFHRAVQQQFLLSENRISIYYFNRKRRIKCENDYYPKNKIFIASCIGNNMS